MRGAGEEEKRPAARQLGAAPQRERARHGAHPIGLEQLDPVADGGEGRLAILGRLARVIHDENAAPEAREIERGQDVEHEVRHVARDGDDLGVLVGLHMTEQVLELACLRPAATPSGEVVAFHPHRRSGGPQPLERRRPAAERHSRARREPIEGDGRNGTEQCCHEPQGGRRR